MQLSVFFISLVGSLFICSFSSVLSAILLVVSALLIILSMYWNLMSMIPLYLFSLVLLGGLFVLIGFVMMADFSDLDMVMSSMKLKECFFSFLGIKLGMSISPYFLANELDFYEFSPMKLNDWMTWGSVSSVFIFLVIVLFVFLFVFHSMMKGTFSGGGFIKI